MQIRRETYGFRTIQISIQSYDELSKLRSLLFYGAKTLDDKDSKEFFEETLRQLDKTIGLEE